MDVFFHFSQIFRKIQKRNLIIQYKTNQKFCELYRSIHALAFVPLNYLKEEIEKLKIFLLKSKIEEIYEIWLDFKKYYCSDVDEKSAKSIFSVHFWSVVCRRSSNIPITTNFLEGWHRSLNNNFIKAHPKLYEFGI
ncbi:hypothetical protein DMUE_2110 [Dictyocoela muelleri]|nr:hypothetical protein DMUE_2110 [Dictyocoela muelleri]